MTSDANVVLEPGDALLVVDVQPDFCPGGALPVEEGHAVVPVLNRWLAATRREEATRPVSAEDGREAIAEMREAGARLAGDDS